MKTNEEGTDFLIQVSIILDICILKYYPAHRIPIFRQK